MGLYQQTILVAIFVVALVICFLAKCRKKLKITLSLTKIEIDTE